MSSSKVLSFIFTLLYHISHVSRVEDKLLGFFEAGKKAGCSEKNVKPFAGPIFMYADVQWTLSTKKCLIKCLTEIRFLVKEKKRH